MAASLMLLSTIPAETQVAVARAAQQQEELQQLSALDTDEAAAVSGGEHDAVVRAGLQLAAAGYRVLAQLYAAEGRTDLSLTTLESAARTVPSASGWMQLAGIEHARDDLPATLRALQRAVALEPTSAAIHLALGNAWWELNEYGYNDDTLQQFTEAQRLNPDDALTNLQLGAILSQFQRYSDAATALKHSAAADPASPDPWLQLGTNLYATGDRAAAEQALRTAVKLTGTDEARNGYQIHRAYLLLSHLEQQSGDDAAAARDRAQAERLHHASAALTAAAPLSESTGLITSRAVHATAAQPADSTPSKPEVTPVQAQAEQRLRALIARGLNDGGTAHARSREYAVAVPLFEAAIAADATLAGAVRNLGLAAFHDGQYAKAVPALRKALDAAPGDTLLSNYLSQATAALHKAQ